MTALTDHELLAEFIRSEAEEAFAALVARHVNLVYSAALRFTGNPHHAQEITQAVFIILARKAGKLSPRIVLSGWLYQTARLTAANFLKGELRRQRREKEAYMQSTLNEPDAAAWEQIAPLLDEAMGGLGEADRNAVVLRFFENKSAAEIAAALRTTEAAAHKRVNRALEKLRKMFTKRGVTLSVGVIAGAVSANSVQAAPAGLAATVTATAAKGAAVGGSTLTLVKGVLKLMAWTKAKTAVVLGAGVMFAATTTFTIVQANQHGDSVQAQVLEIVRTNSWNYLSDDVELQQLIAIGPKALEPLRDLVEWRESGMRQRYERLWSSLPAALRTHLRDPRVQAEMHQKAVQIAYELGPAAVRPLNSSLCRFLDNPDTFNTDYPLRSLYWTVPESTEAIATVKQWLSDPTRRHLFGSMDCWELYPLLPETTPSLIRCLRNPYLARDAAIGLGTMKTNATQAIPALIEVCDHGVAQPPLNPGYKIGYTSNGEPFLMNRCAAFETLGKIGVTSPDVLGAIDHGLADANEDVRFAALNSLAALHQPLAGRLTNTLTTFSVRRSIKFQRIIEWVGTLKKDGEPALPWLRQFTQLDEVQTLPEGVQASVGDFAVSPDYFRLSAIIAICRIDPEETRHYLPDLIAEVGRRWEPVELLMDSKAFASDVIVGLEPVLNDTNRSRSGIAAYVILGFEPRHTHAMATLRSRVAQGSLSERITAARWLWKRTGETNDVLPFCIEGLASPESYIGQNAASILDEMGQQARPAVPALKAALWHRDRFIRTRAGNTLRKIAPEEMPPIS